MRLPEMISNPRFKDETELMFFHGTATTWLDSFITNGIGILKLNKKKDLGQGFYLTTRYWQAKDYANRIAKATQTEPLIISCVIRLGDLRENLQRGLIIDDFNEEWLETLIRGRFFPENPLANDYDWVYGRCGDGKTIVFEREYKKQHNTDLKALLPHIIPREDSPHYQYDQLWLGTKIGIKCIQSVELINKEGVSDARIPIH